MIEIHTIEQQQQHEITKTINENKKYVEKRTEKWESYKYEKSSGQQCSKRTFAGLDKKHAWITLFIEHFYTFCTMDQVSQMD